MIAKVSDVRTPSRRDVGAEFKPALTEPRSHLSIAGAADPSIDDHTRSALVACGDSQG